MSPETNQWFQHLAHQAQAHRNDKLRRADRIARKTRGTR